MKKIIGITFISLAVLLATNPFGVLPAIPIYIIGIILLLYSTIKKKFKIYIIIIPLILWYPLIYLSKHLSTIIGMEFGQKLEFRFNENFRGEVTIVSPIKWGQKVKIVNGREIINIPKNGIAYYQGNINDGYSNWTYVTVSKSGVQKKINEFRTWEMTDFDKRHIKSDSLGVTGGGGMTVGTKGSGFNLRVFWINEWNKMDEKIYNEDSIIKIIKKEIVRNKNFEKNNSNK